jgi:hypothetical protein
MPKATVDPQTHHRELKTCPGGYVELRTLSFHEMQMRQDVAARMYQETKVRNAKRQAPREADETVRAYFDVMNVAVTEFEFRNCIVEHNLFIDDAETTPIDFTKPMHTWKLDPKIGAEIGRLIDELNQESDEDEVAPLPLAPTSSSLDEKTKPSPSLVESE